MILKAGFHRNAARTYRHESGQIFPEASGVAQDPIKSVPTQQRPSVQMMFSACELRQAADSRT